MPDLPPDWETLRSADEWKAIARDFAQAWAAQNHALMVDPNYIHWLARELPDGKLFRIDDVDLKGRYVQWLDRNRPRI